MLKQLKYFQSVVQNNSFSVAAQECNISQSAISQQVKSLEEELGFPLLERKNRKFSLTLAGEVYYKKTMLLINEYEHICQEAKVIASGGDFVLKVGYLRGYCGEEFQLAVEQFSIKYPDIPIEIRQGNHEELYRNLKSGNVDLVLNDQRRAFSDEYVNLELHKNNLFVELPLTNPFSSMDEIEVKDLKQIPCILIASKEEEEEEESFYRDIIGIEGEILFARNLEQAKMLAISQKGCLPLEGDLGEKRLGNTLKNILLLKDGKTINRTYCAFWKQNNSGYYVEEFADLLKKSYKFF